LDYVRTVNGFTTVHATLDQPQRWAYVFDKLAAAASFACQETALCFFGHTHVPMVFIQHGVVLGGSFSKLKIEPGKKYFVNAGSVGQPRDHNRKAAYVSYDMAAATIELRRINYDIGTAGQKILAIPPLRPGP
jgi:predicted phosphodiesterase